MQGNNNLHLMQVAARQSRRPLHLVRLAHSFVQERVKNNLEISSITAAFDFRCSCLVLLKPIFPSRDKGVDVFLKNKWAVSMFPGAFLQERRTKKEQAEKVRQCSKIMKVFTSSMKGK